MNQKLSVQGAVAATTLLWGGFVFLVSMGHHFVPSYGVKFLEWLGSIYPGYVPEETWRSVVVATSYAIVDGAVTGFLFAIIYNFFARRRSSGEGQITS